MPLCTRSTSVVESKTGSLSSCRSASANAGSIVHSRSTARTLGASPTAVRTSESSSPIVFSGSMVAAPAPPSAMSDAAKPGMCSQPTSTKRDASAAGSPVTSSISFSLASVVARLSDVTTSTSSSAAKVVESSGACSSDERSTGSLVILAAASW